MANYNRVILIGNVTRDIDLKYTQSGLAVTEIGLAVKDRRKTQSGEWVEETTFVDVTFWGRYAEVASEYLSKGSPIFVEGRLKLDTWETDGQKRSKLRVVCERMQMLSTRGGGGGGAAGGQEQPSRQFDESEYSHPAPTNLGERSSAGAPSAPSAPPDDDIPF